MSGVEAWVREFARLAIEEAPRLTELDSAIGDADHGSNLARGLTAVVAALDATSFDDDAALLKKVGMVLVSTVGGASGPLYGTFFLRAAGALPGGVPAAFRAGVDGVAARGKSTTGEKTMLDALVPAVEALEAGKDWGEVRAAAETGRDATIPLVARKGRASYLGERSAGHLDPGAASATLLVAAAASTLVADA
ncbi:dihydroxyacetone kinase subunit DhaL [Cryptosporangium arvum]|jgi:dihydroxyacetone kinase-like protein|uniref:dihydroxyacetone kinase subunit DhaL n=1 Tax=Cryptosporangium arvum TaxID=80871 RepID=UPI0004BA7F42|nr:dihydroxyacetone kinase subunit DhaL [Cryptosporangium arvum]